MKHTNRKVRLVCMLNLNTRNKMFFEFLLHTAVHSDTICTVISKHCLYAFLLWQQLVVSVCSVSVPLFTKCYALQNKKYMNSGLCRMCVVVFSCKSVESFFSIPLTVPCFCSYHLKQCLMNITTFWRRTLSSLFVICYIHHNPNMCLCFFPHHNYIIRFHKGM